MARRVRLWWWGEDEAPGLGSWIARASLAHEHRTGVHVESRLLAHDRVIGSVARAAEGDAPDLHFLWNGIYHIEDAWRGHLAPLEDLLDPATIEGISGGPQSRYGGKTFRAAWYVIPVIWVANRNALEQAGVSALPSTWDEFATACELLAAAGTPPVVCGDGEGDFSVWWLTHLLTQGFDRGADVAQLALGEHSWRERSHAVAWKELRRFVDKGWLDSSSLELTLWDAFARFCDGLGAFTLASGPMLGARLRRLDDRFAVMLAPRLGNGELAGLPIVDTQGFGIPARARDAQAGAALLESLLGLDQADALYERVGLLPARPGWQGRNRIDEPNVLRMWDWYESGATAPYVPNLLPLPVHYDVCAAIGQSVIAGSMAPEEAAREADQRCARWRRTDGAAVESYRQWILSVARDEDGLRAYDH